MISFILVSHSKKITDGLKEMIDQMALNQENVTGFFSWWNIRWKSRNRSNSNI